MLEDHVINELKLLSGSARQSNSDVYNSCEKLIDYIESLIGMKNKKKWEGKLSGEQAEMLQEALLSAFDWSGLSRLMYFKLGQSLATIAGGQNLAEVVFNLILWVERKGRTEELILKARASNPGNQDLRRFAEDIFGINDDIR